MQNLLGEIDEDLVSFVLEHVKDKKSADTLVDGLEPVSHRCVPKLRADICGRRYSVCLALMAPAGVRERCLHFGYGYWVLAGLRVCLMHRFSLLQYSSSLCWEWK
jgi:hypothetical protein